MMNLQPQHRFHVPNSLAVFAAILLLVSSVVGFEAERTDSSLSQETMTTSQADSGGIADSTQRKSRGLNLGLLLFRRG